MKTQKFIGITIILAILVGLPSVSAQDAAGVERTVRLVYFLPNDLDPQPKIDTRLNVLIKDVQQFFANEMERHGYGKKTFRFESDPNNTAIVHHVNGLRNEAYYRENITSVIWEELQEQLDFFNHIYVICVEISGRAFGNNGDVCGYGNDYGDGGYVLIPTSGSCFEDPIVTAHELGHAFGLQHDFREMTNLMTYGIFSQALSECAAEWLNVHPYLNPDKAITRNTDTHINLLSYEFDAAPPHALKLRFEVNDPDGLVQAQLLTDTTEASLAQGFPEVVDCKSLNGTSDTVEFVTNRILNDVRLHVIDKQGNFIREQFDVDITARIPETDIVSIPDPNLAATIRETFNYPPDKQVTTFDMARLPYLTIISRGITDLTGLEHAVGMESLILTDNQVQDLTPLYALPELKYLRINGNPMIDLTQLPKLRHLTRLYLAGNEIRDLTPLANMTHLSVLVLDSNEIRDLTPLAKLTQLTTLWLGFNQITDVTPLANLTELTWLELNQNQIRDITPLQNLTHLTSLILQFNQIDDTRPLKKLVDLRVLYIDNNPLIDDISGLADMTKLKLLQLPKPLITDITPLSRLTNLVELDIRENQIRDITPLANLTNLRALTISVNPITDITPLSRLTNLVELYMWECQISDITAIVNMTQLEYFTASKNKITDITPLTNLTQLKGVNVSNNQITDASPLTRLINLDRLHIYGNPIADKEPLFTLMRNNPGVKIYHKNNKDPLPVTLSSFKATRTAEGVILNWTTESEVNNAGFNILRSHTKTGEFQKINAKLIQGAGTTGKRSTYSWTDTTAKPNTVYYYQIEDVSHAGQRKRLATVRLRGFVSASGKLQTRWAVLKNQNAY